MMDFVPDVSQTVLGLIVEGFCPVNVIVCAVGFCRLVRGIDRAFIGTAGNIAIPQ